MKKKKRMKKEREKRWDTLSSILRPEERINDDHRGKDIYFLIVRADSNRIRSYYARPMIILFETSYVDIIIETISLSLWKDETNP